MPGAEEKLMRLRHRRGTTLSSWSWFWFCSSSSSSVSSMGFVPYRRLKSTTFSLCGLKEEGMDGGIGVERLGHALWPL